PPRPRKLNAAIPRDLETIVLKAIDREPRRRYQNARALAEDLQCFLDDKPIRARRAGASERLWRWCRRNPAVASLSAAILMLLVTLAAVSALTAFHFQRLAHDEKLRVVKESLLRRAAETARGESENNLQEAQRQKKLAEANL